MAEIKDRLKCERLRKDLNQTELAKFLNVSKQTVSNWENGNRIPDTLTLSKLADFFNCSVDYILGRSENRNGIISKANIDGSNYEFELDKSIFPNGITREQMINYIKELEDRNKELEKEAEISRKLKEAGFDFNPDK
ncbi:transcriptional regulator [Clostridium botulinum]|uniref:DNA-binding protein n=1 Tax=Clostridium botulinum (strain Hall / ATCC 3502 / NCTC 13319 / Type A) TaxID=441771 RepID=A5I6C6_CLOBH|nr:helix-turn-helix transcriptional regulator [Clostridium botulinum]ABS34249.1 DNA-binding protein [Clostridium botulinum A str. ATCC 19397]ABS37846.1 DNA-binding protein [Clostridium botulinum A str. Hall]EPS47188.1 DNA-binding protein [Clostridium botulinum CFSAN002369]EPS48862.1 DNA-binding protein [Clostridium botulinum CFSAN002367]KEI77017.1 DNA-binding protein [Clostridium botulinum B2 128]KEI90695.1 DNA-binding protein [Clostridium botulinum B2 433]CAL84608.1 putative DNA-binding pro